MKRKIGYLLVAAVLTAAMLVGCSGGKPATPSSPEEVKGETFDAGQISVLVPEGWKAFPAADLLDQYEGDNDPTGLSVYKGAKSEWDQLTKPGITISSYKTEEFLSSKDWYTDAKDIEVGSIGSYTCTGYTGTSLDYPYTVVEMVDGDTTIQAAILMENEGAKIALEDVDVQAILASIKTAK